MIIVLIPVLALIIAILLYISKKIHSTEKKVSLTILIFNIAVMLFLRLLWPGVTHYANITVLFLISVLINVILLILLLNSKIIFGKKTYIGLLFMYILCMCFMPVYKVEGHKHIYINENVIDSYTNNINEDTDKINSILEQLNTMIETKIEKIEEYVDYYNCYGIKIKSVYKNN